MSFPRLVDAMAAKAADAMPIRVDAVREWIIKAGLQDEIVFIPSDIDPTKLRGVIHQFTYRPKVYGEPIRASDIYFARPLNVCWTRLVCCKEMMHIFDRDDQKAGSRQLVGQLTFDLVTPPAPDAPMSPQVLSDWLAIVKALIVLAPLEILEALRPYHESGEKKPYDIALFLRIPEAYIAYIFSKRFLDDRKFLLGA